MSKPHSEPEFPAASLEAWAKAAAKSAPGGDLGALNWQTPDGISVKPLYTAEDIKDLPHTNTLPGFEPFIRGPQATMDDKFPYALNESIVSPDKLKQVFARKLVVLLGEADIQTDAANLPKARQATAQGVNRFERGSNFFAQAQAQAQKLGAPLAWERVTVPGVGHDSRRMSQAAARLLFEPAR